MAGFGRGRTFGPPRGEGPGYHDRSGVGGTGGIVSAGPRCHTPGSSRDDRISRIRGTQRCKWRGDQGCTRQRVLAR